MSPRLRTLSGREVLRALGSFGFVVARTRGSHATLRREINGKVQLLTVLDVTQAPGTLRAIYRQACRFVPETELRGHFFSS